MSDVEDELVLVADPTTTGPSDPTTSGPSDQSPGVAVDTVTPDVTVELRTEPVTTTSEEEVAQGDAVVVVEPPPPIERVNLCGLTVDLKRSMDPERVEKVTSGRRKVPLSMICRPGGTDYATSAGLDFYIAVVCVSIVQTGDHAGIIVSDLIFSGPTEVKILFGDPSDIPGGLSLDRIVGTCLLVMNPTVAAPNVLHVPSLRLCLRLGHLTGLSKCEAENCVKPVLVDRDGTLCYIHTASRVTGRLSIGGSSIDLEELRKADLLAANRAKRQAERSALTAEEKLAKIQEHKRETLLAKKKTALMLFERQNRGQLPVQSSLSKTSATTRFEVTAKPCHNVVTIDVAGGGRVNATHDSGELMLDIGELSDDAGTDIKEKVERFEILKRKREAMEKRDSNKAAKALAESKTRERQAELIVQEQARVVTDENGIQQVNRTGTERKSISQQVAEVIKAERGF